MFTENVAKHVRISECSNNTNILSGNMLIQTCLQKNLTEYAWISMFMGNYKK